MKAITLFVPIFITCFNSVFAMQKPLIMQHIQNAEDAAQFAGHVVAYSPVSFIDDSRTYKEGGWLLAPGVRYGYVSPHTVDDWKYDHMSLYEKKVNHVERAHNLELLVTTDIVYARHLLLSRVLSKEDLFLRKITRDEAMGLMHLLRTTNANFEGLENYSYRPILLALDRARF